ncbi:hypothetical protein L0Y65_05260 [Candidatus Micrarchaeota archaeon]|nr:hypothetical protein [Candidatus Micrarchaeota archaeon]
MNNGLRSKADRADSAGASGNVRRRLVLGAALLAGSLMGGCGDTINNYYYTGPDGGAKADSMSRTDSGKPDSLVADVLKADACVGKARLPECSDKVLVAGVLNQGESLTIPAPAGGGSYRLLLDDGQVLDNKNYAVVSLLDDCGNILTKSKIEEGSAKLFTLGGQALDVQVTEAAFGMTFGAKWANFTVKSPCEDATLYWCPAVMGVLNQGESILVDNLKFRLDDIESTGALNSAIISVIDANNNIIKKDKIAEGSSVEMVVGGKHYLLTVNKVAAGYTFGAKWAEIEISGQAQKPCGS